MWYNKKYICSLSQTVHSIELLIPLEFLHNDSLLNMPEFMLMRWFRMGPLDSLRMGLVTRKTKWLKGWNFQTHLLTSGKRRSLDIQALERRSIMSFWTVEYIHVPRWWYTPLHRDISSCAWDPSVSHPMYLFTWLFICILYSKQINQNKVLPEFCELFSKIIEP